MAIVLALLAAAGWGSSDYAAGVASRRSSVISVVVLTHLVAAVVLGVLVLEPGLLRELDVVVRHMPGASGRRPQLTLEVLLPARGPRVAPLADLLWGMAGGVSGGLGAVLLYRGLARGAVNVVAPITAVGAAVLPVLFGLATGESLGLVGLGAIGLALLAVVLISEPNGQGPALAPYPVDGDPPAFLARTSALVVRRAAIDPRTYRATLLAVIAAIVTAAAAGGPTLATLLSTGSLSVLGAAALAFASCSLTAGVALWTGRPRRRPPHARRPLSRFRRGAVRAEGASRWGQPGVLEALGSGLGFGGFYLLLGRTSAEAGLWPVFSARGASVLFFVAAALVNRDRLLPVRGDRRVVLAAGALDALAAAFFLAATRQGLLSIVAVLSSLYPAATIGLARLFDSERCSRIQLVGMATAGVSVAALAVA